MITGNPKFQGLAIGEFTCNVMGTTVSLKAKAAFIDTQTNMTHGWTEGNVWTPPTILKMRELLAAMEEDMARQHFAGAAVTSDAPTAGAPGLSGGLSEHVGTENGSQV